MVKSIAKIGSQKPGELFMLRMTFTESEVKVLHYQRFYHPPCSDLALRAANLEAHFLATPPLSLTAVAATIEQPTGIKRSHTQTQVGFPT